MQLSDFFASPDLLRSTAPCRLVTARLASTAASRTGSRVIWRRDGGRWVDVPAKRCVEHPAVLSPLLSSGPTANITGSCEFWVGRQPNFGSLLPTPARPPNHMDRTLACREGWALFWGVAPHHRWF